LTKQNLLDNSFKITVIYIKILIYKEIREREREREKKSLVVIIIFNEQNNNYLFLK